MLLIKNLLQLIVYTCANLQAVRRRRPAGTMPLMAPRAFTVRGVYKTEELGQGLGGTTGGGLGLRAPPIDIGRLQNLGDAYKFIAAWKAVRHVPIPLAKEGQQRRQMLEVRAAAAASSAQMPGLFPQLQGSALCNAIIDTALHLEGQDGLGQSLHEDESSTDAAVMLVPPDTACSACKGPLYLREEKVCNAFSSAGVCVYDVQGEPLPAKVYRKECLNEACRSVHRWATIERPPFDPSSGRGVYSYRRGVTDLPLWLSKGTVFTKELLGRSRRWRE